MLLDFIRAMIFIAAISVVVLMFYIMKKKEEDDRQRVARERQIYRDFGALCPKDVLRTFTTEDEGKDLCQTVQSGKGAVSAFIDRRHEEGVLDSNDAARAKAFLEHFATRSPKAVCVDHLVVMTRLVVGPQLGHDISLPPPGLDWRKAMRGEE